MRRDTNRIKDRSNAYRMPNIRFKPDKIFRDQQEGSSNHKHCTDRCKYISNQAPGRHLASAGKSCNIKREGDRTAIVRPSCSVKMRHKDCDENGLAVFELIW